MSDRLKRGISRQGLDADFEKEEIRKSNLLLEAQLLLGQNLPDEAALKFVQAAEIEERLADICETMKLSTKALVHRFSAVCCWAQAGNFHSAINLGEQLLAQADLPEPLRRHIFDYTHSLRRRRAQWAAETAAIGMEV